MESRFAWYTTPPEWTPHWFPFRDNSALSFAVRGGWAIPFNDIGDYDLPGAAVDPGAPSEFRPIDKIDTDLELPLTERYFLGGLGNFQLRGFKARSVGPRRAVLKRTGLAGLGDFFTPVGRELVPETEDVVTTEGDFVRRAGRGERKIEPVRTGGLVSVCNDTDNSIQNNQGNKNGKCNSLYTKHIDDFEDLKETDVIGGNKFVSFSTEYRFPISETLGLVGILFFDTGNAFGENEDVWEFDLWRFGTGFGGLWFSPFGPLQAFIGFPLDKLEVEDSVVFEFSVGGANSF
jgi:outer membrane protein assembly factor BamA